MAMFAVPCGDPVFDKEDCSPFDIFLVYSRIARFADGDKFQFIQNIWKPAMYSISSLCLWKLVESFENSGMNSYFAFLGLCTPSMLMEFSVWTEMSHMVCIKSLIQEVLKDRYLVPENQTGQGRVYCRLLRTTGMI